MVTFAQTISAQRKHAGELWQLYSALRRSGHELDRWWQRRWGGWSSRLRAAIREREAPTVQTSGQKISNRHIIKEQGARLVNEH